MDSANGLGYEYHYTSVHVFDCIVKVGLLERGD